MPGRIARHPARGERCHPVRSVTGPVSAIGTRREGPTGANLICYGTSIGNGVTMSQEARSGPVCRCGHAYIAHQHYRSGSECSQCLDCPRYRPAAGPVQRIINELACRRGNR